MKEKMIKYLSICCIIFFLPYIITLLLNNKQAVVVSKQITIEDYLPAMVYLDIPKDYLASYQSMGDKEKAQLEEFIKAQAVVTRTNFYFRRKTESVDFIVHDASELLKNNIHNLELQQNLKQIKNVLESVNHKILACEGQIVESPFHKVSGGKTRTGEEVYQNKDYNYLTGVESDEDVESPDYLKGHFFTPDALYERLIDKYPDSQITMQDVANQIKIYKSDSADYVLSLYVGKTLVSGEEIRRVLELSSSNFTIQSYKDGIRFLCKGLGHGMGMSQYGAMKMSIKGNNFEEILKHYFPNQIIITQNEK